MVERLRLDLPAPVGNPCVRSNIYYFLCGTVKQNPASQRMGCGKRPAPVGFHLKNALTGEGGYSLLVK